MDTSNSLLLNRVFTQNVIKKLIDQQLVTTYITTIKRYITDPENKKNQQLISEIYSKLNSQYRNEYFYKNTLLNKLLLGIHSPRTTTALTEIPVAKSIADFILINGKAVVYEIKTELDNFDRLEGQYTFRSQLKKCITIFDRIKYYNLACKKLKELNILNI